MIPKEDCIDGILKHKTNQNKQTNQKTKNKTNKKQIKQTKANKPKRKDDVVTLKTIISLNYYAWMELSFCAIHNGCKVIHQHLQSKITRHYIDWNWYIEYHASVILASAYERSAYGQTTGNFTHIIVHSKKKYPKLEHWKL